MENNWIFNGKMIEDSDVEKGAIGFIYCITQISTGKKYFGRKFLTLAATKTTNGIKKKIRKDSGWKNYWSSSPFLQELVKTVGEDDFKREILIFCHSKAFLNYAEEKILFSLGVLESDNFFNGNIRSKIMKTWFKNFKNLDKLNLSILDLHLQNHLLLQEQKAQNKLDKI